MDNPIKFCIALNRSSTIVCFIVINIIASQLTIIFHKVYTSCHNVSSVKSTRFCHSTDWSRLRFCCVLLKFLCMNFVNISPMCPTDGLSPPPLLSYAAVLAVSSKSFKKDSKSSRHRRRCLERVFVLSCGASTCGYFGP